MGTQIRRRRAAAATTRSLQPPEKSHHAIDLETRATQQIQTNSVGLTLSISAKTQLSLRSEACTTHHGRHRQIRAGPRGQHREQQTRQRQQRILALIANHAGNVPLGDVTDFVRQHRGQLGFGLRGQYQTRVHTDKTARQGKGIQGRIAYGKKQEVITGIAPRLGTGGQQNAAGLVQVIQHGRIIDVIAVTTDIVHHLLTQTALHQGRQFLAVRAAKIRQSLRLQDRGRQQRGRGKCKHRCRHDAQQRTHRPGTKTKFHGAMIPATNFRSQHPSEDNFPHELSQESTESCRR